MELLSSALPYEELKVYGHFGLVEGVVMEMLRHEMGGGFSRAILTGTRSGNRYWMLTYGTLRDTLDSPVQLPSGDVQAQASYVWDFFCRHKTGYIEVDRPFTIVNLATKKRFLVRFADHSMERTMFNVKLYTSQLKLQYARVPGFNTLDDGSIGDAENPAQI